METSPTAIIWVEPSASSASEIDRLPTGSQQFLRHLRPNHLFVFVDTEKQATVLSKYYYSDLLILVAFLPLPLPGSTLNSGKHKDRERRTIIFPSQPPAPVNFECLIIWGPLVYSRVYRGPTYFKCFRSLMQHRPSIRIYP